MIHKKVSYNFDHPVVCLAVATHVGFKWLKPAKNKLRWSDFTNAFMQVSVYSNSFHFRSFWALHIQNLSNCCRYKYDPSISRIFQSNSWRVFDVWNHCATLLSPSSFDLRFQRPTIVMWYLCRIKIASSTGDILNNKPEVDWGEIISECVVLKFMYSKKATKIKEIFTVNLTLTT